MQQEGFLIGAFERIDELLVIGCAKRGNDHRLRFTAGEER